ncbi:hypothetical protein [Bacillus thermotolerans]|uniref:Uncharacterized protein n=1 Tax=Bacillus thermotolerans TaxID=1221996 RepID=A0A0F5HTB2_BACTR|nr:hypothetical protein [Bacillus thermotolerans]KKB36275.1 hypothetical protein QY95_03139 [Bacillus thermotolerans]KKB44813.1 hypothetical protein QY96_01094 [Bacillus thermotolerans]
MIKATAFIFITLLLATVSGVYAQSIAYFISDRMHHLQPFECLYAVTVCSWILYLSVPLQIYLFTRKGHLKKDHWLLYTFLSVSVGAFVSFWSLFVLAMSAG